MRNIFYCLLLLVFTSCATDDVKESSNNNQVSNDKNVELTYTEKAEQDVNQVDIAEVENELVTNTTTDKNEVVKVESSMESKPEETVEPTDIIHESNEKDLEYFAPPTITEPVVEVVFNHQSWNDLLQKHVSSSGVVNYKGFKNDKALLEAYLEELKNNKLGEHATKNEKLAYWINVYNAFTVKLIVDNYPLKSITDLNKAWDQKIVDVGKELLSLSHVENEILRKMNEPRIHFAINCASVSCPKLMNKAFTAEKLSAQLKQVTNDFFSDKSRNDLTQTPLALSKIFEWYAADFEKGAIVKYINKETDYNFAEDTKITFKEYDWSLNE